MTDTIHINRPSSTRFIPQIRFYGCRNWITVGPERRDYRRAIMDMAKNFASGNYKRGRVLCVADYYDPTIIVEMVSR